MPFVDPRKAAGKGLHLEKLKSGLSNCSNTQGVRKPSFVSGKSLSASSFCSARADKENVSSTQPKRTRIGIFTSDTDDSDLDSMSVSTTQYAKPNAETKRNDDIIEILASPKKPGLPMSIQRGLDTNDVIRFGDDDDSDENDDPVFTGKQTQQAKENLDDSSASIPAQPKTTKNSLSSGTTIVPSGGKSIFMDDSDDESDKSDVLDVHVDGEPTRFQPHLTAPGTVEAHDQSSNNEQASYPSMSTALAEATLKNTHCEEANSASDKNELDIGITFTDEDEAQTLHARPLASTSLQSGANLTEQPKPAYPYDCQEGDYDDLWDLDDTRIESAKPATFAKVTSHNTVSAPILDHKAMKDELVKRYTELNGLILQTQMLVRRPEITSSEIQDCITRRGQLLSDIGVQEELLFDQTMPSGTEANTLQKTPSAFTDGFDTLLNHPTGANYSPPVQIIGESPPSHQVPSGGQNGPSSIVTGQDRNADCPSEMVQTLRRVFKMQDFRACQRDAISAALSGRDVFVLMPTGGGKSLCYQLPAVMSIGCTIVVSPLLALIDDQVNALRARGIEADYINSTTEYEQKMKIYRSLRRSSCSPQDGLKLLYVTPEGLAAGNQLKSVLSEAAQKGNIARVAIDEAHCVSQWGHDFRSDYLKLGEVRNFLGAQIPIMALTATASKNVHQDIIHQLQLRNVAQFTSSFNRPNLAYAVVEKTNKVELMIADTIQERFSGKCGIVYCLSRKECESLSSFLGSSGISASAYHAGMTPTQRTKIQQLWGTGQKKVICATIAFGMGIDKADVRFVLHACLPSSIEGYYQETGRAGRDGYPSDCILFFAVGDINRRKRLNEMELKRPGKRVTQQVRDQLRMKNAALKEMAAFCENKSDCRRLLQLRYLGEEFNPALCGGTCDNCASKQSRNREIVEERMDDQGWVAVSQVIATCANREWNKTEMVQALRLGIGMGPDFRAMRHITDAGIHRFLEHLVSHGVVAKKNDLNNRGDRVLETVVPGPRQSKVQSNDPALKNFRFIAEEQVSFQRQRAQEAKDKRNKKSGVHRLGGIDINDDTGKFVSRNADFTVHQNRLRQFLKEDINQVQSLRSKFEDPTSVEDAICDLCVELPNKKQGVLDILKRHGLESLNTNVNMTWMQHLSSLRSTCLQIYHDKKEGKGKKGAAKAGRKGAKRAWSGAKGRTPKRTKTTRKSKGEATFTESNMGPPRDTRPLGNTASTTSTTTSKSTRRNVTGGVVKQASRRYNF
eukprot:Clim_evm39s143 gene=Clim_evmTU39s143